MAGALGFAIGATLNGLSGYAAEKTAQKHEHQQMWDQFMTKNLNGNPEFAQTAEGRKEVKRLYGEHADAAQAAYDFAAQAKQQSQQQLAGAMGKEPQTMQEWQDHANKLAQFSALHANDPNFAQIKPQLDAEVKRAETQVSQMRVDQRDREFHAEHEQDVAGSRADRQQFHADAMQNAQAMRQVQAANVESSNELKTIMANLAVGEAAEEKQKNFDTAKSNLTKQLQNINKAIAGSSTATPMNATAVKPLLDSYNKQAADLAKRAKTTGVEYDPDEFKPLKVEDVPNHPFLGSHSSVSTTLSSTEDSAPAVPIGATASGPGGPIKWDGKKWNPVK